MKTTKRALIAICLASAVTAVGVQAGAAQERLIFPSFSLAGSTNGVFFNAWAKRVNEASKGTLNVEIRDGSTLANFGNAFDRVMDDVIQIGWVQHGMVAGRFALSGVASLPFLSDGDVNCSATMWRLYESGLLDEEYKEVMPLWFGCLSPNHMHFSKKPESIEQLNGMRLRVNAKAQGQMVESVKGAPISMAAGNMYESMQRGTIDGVVSSWAGLGAFKLQEVAHYHYEIPMGSTVSMFAMSKKKFESLPPQAKKALLDNIGEAQSRAAGELFAQQASGTRKLVESLDKNEIVKVSPEAMKSLEAIGKTIQANWVKETPGGQKVLETFQSLYEKVSKR
jgi:TRAP-type transport system periplasmic protein